MDIMLSERSQSQKDKCCMIPLMGYLKGNVFYRQKKNTEVGKYLFIYLGRKVFIYLGKKVFQVRC